MPKIEKHQAPAERPGLTLLELLVVLAILALLIGLLIPAVQKVRMAALRMQVTNQLRQLSISQQNFAVSHGPLPPPTAADRTRGGGNVFSVLLPYLEQDAVELPSESGLAIKNYMSPADPSFAFYPTQTGNCSFAVNSLTCWVSGVPIPQEMSDGSSNTIVFAERYARCQQQNVYWSLGQMRCFNPVLGQEVPCGLTSDRRATFADRMFVDVLPKPGPEPGTTGGTVAGLTFQNAPSPSLCDGRIVQSSFASGLLVAMGDGSLRIIRPTVSPTVYWALVTPDGSEVIGER